MSIVSGRFATVDGIGTVRNWTVQSQSTNPKFTASNTRAGSGRRPGVKSWSGSVSTYGYFPQVIPGQIFSFVGYTEPGGMTYEGNAIVDSLAITWNWKTGDILQTTINFSGDGELTNDTGTYADNSYPTARGMCGLIVKLDDVEWDNVVQATLTLTSANQSYVNSSTNCWTKRKAGIFDWTLSVQEEGAVDINLGDDLQIKLYVNDTQYWNLKYGTVKDFTGITVDIETGAIIGRTVNFEMNGFSEAGVTGFVKMPGGYQIWPATGTTTTSTTTTSTTTTAGP